jgi:thioredoxin 1
MPQQITDDNFAEKVLNTKGVVMVDFWAEWCPPCRVLGPIIEQVAGMTKDQANVYKLDVDHNQKTAMKYGIRSIPTVKVFKDGQPVEDLIGLQPMPVYLNAIKHHAA